MLTYQIWNGEMWYTMKIFIII